MAKEVAAGTRDHCRHCGKVIVYGPEPRAQVERREAKERAAAGPGRPYRGYYGRYYQWWHIPDGPKGDWVMEGVGRPKQPTEEHHMYPDMATNKKYGGRDNIPEELWRHRAEPVTFCTRRLQTDSYTVNSRLCHRMIKDTDLMLCGIHAGHIRRQQKEEEEREKHRDTQEWIKDNVDTMVETLKEEYGISAATHSRRIEKAPWYYYTGNIVLDPQALLALLEKLEGKVKPDSAEPEEDVDLDDEDEWEDWTVG